MIVVFTLALVVVSLSSLSCFYTFVVLSLSKLILLLYFQCCRSRVAGKFQFNHQRMGHFNEVRFYMLSKNRLKTYQAQHFSTWLFSEIVEPAEFDLDVVTSGCRHQRWRSQLRCCGDSREKVLNLKIHIYVTKLQHVTILNLSYI